MLFPRACGQPPLNALCTHWRQLSCQDFGSPPWTDDSKSISSTFTVLNCRPMYSPTLQIARWHMPSVISNKLSYMSSTHLYHSNLLLLYSFTGMHHHRPKNGKAKPKHHAGHSPLLASPLQLVTRSWCDFLLSIPQVHPPFPHLFSSTLAFTSRVTAELSV